ncbi:FHA domain-containing protein [Agreia sp. COWG]|uniref:FHA domain-containing protein n=1 Tax=Agreia sp. COWG TaxID=2773266 RepID=UPI00192642E9|nr:FHA domain-containing protein [Agreia sp. COWG]CAD5998226.1 conserved protein of unknown function [Agreia sp. COWG]
MATTVRLDADLSFRVDEPDAEGSIVSVIDGTVRASGTVVEIEVSDPALLVDRSRRSLARVREFAEGLAHRGLTVRLLGPKGVVGELGDVAPSLAQRVASGSPHIKLGKAGAVAGAVLRRTGSSGAQRIGLPPATPFPLVPMLGPQRKLRPTTTHYLPGSGRPRLIFVIGSENWNGQPPREFDLLPGSTTIGSGASCDLQLDGLEPVHATVRHTSDDEYILTLTSVTPGDVPLLERENPRSRSDRLLRTGARIELGPWRMAYFREEFADHGRPFGGRVGGEFSRQKPQPPRKTGEPRRGREQ